MNRVTKSVELKEQEVGQLQDMLRKGTHQVRMLKRTEVLLGLEQGLKPQQVAQQVGVSLATVYNITARYRESGQLAEALQEKPRSGQPTKFSKAAQAQLTALACSAALQGHSKWSLRLLADKLVELQIVESISHQAVGEQLKKPTQALVEETVVYRYYRWGIFSQNGRRIGRLQPTSSPSASSPSTSSRC